MYTVGIDLFTGALAMGRNNNSSHQKYSLLELVPYLDVFSLLSTTSEEKKNDDVFGRVAHHTRANVR